ncbi:MAG: prolyl oligopeptidase family serine peptidase [Actinomycetota bacterium]|nr:prolyl oligopeptidase family serine peptidase [Actinomycetota bacterium]
MTDTFPRQHARTRRFTLGRPRTFVVGPDGGRVVYCRSLAGDDPVNRLWSLDVASGTETLVADPAKLLDDGDADLPAEERRRRERAREAAGGVVSYATDDDVAQACFALGGRLFQAELDGSDVADLEAQLGAFDPRFDPSGTRIAYVAGTTLRIVGALDRDRHLLGEEDPLVSWGSAEFVAAEEMGRSRGFWWAPSGDRLAVARVDNSPVATWHLADPANPATEPTAIRYPAAGTADADVRLFVSDLGGIVTDVEWDRERFPYLADVRWSSGAPLTIVVMSRDQRTLVVATVDVATGASTEVHRITDDAWVELIGGAPRWWDGRLVTVEDRGAARRLVIGGDAVTGDDLQVRSIVGPLDGSLVVAASRDDPAEVDLFAVDRDGAAEQLTPGGGICAGAVGGGTLVVTRTTDDAAPLVEVRRGGEVVATIDDVSESPLVSVNVSLGRHGGRDLRTALLLPSGERADGPLPVLLDPYGGPHAQRVLRSRDAYLVSQWFADQGFAVLVTDGRGTPGRGPEWERAVAGDLAAPVLEDQVDALMAVAEGDDRLDLSKVAIRGWSFGGYLAALAVLRRPDVFAAAIAGAPVTDWRLYDTFYTERYLGHPDTAPEAYERCDLTAEAASLTRPLMLVHGLADDNVVAAHTLRLSSALLAAGRPHEVLPLSGVTHMTPQEVVAENLLRLQVEFLRRSLGLVGDGDEAGDT